MFKMINKKILYCCIFLVLSSLSYALDTTNIIAYYSYDSDYNDDGLYNRNPTVTNNPEFNTGILGNSIKCNNTVNLNVSNSDGKLAPTNIKSVNFWMKKISFTTTDNQFILGDFAGGKERGAFSIDTNILTGQDLVVAYEDTTHYLGSSFWYGFGSISTSNYYMITLVINGTNVKYFKNNTLLAESTRVAQPLGTTRLTFNICHDGTISGSYYIDEILISNTSLSFGDVSQLYNSGSGYNPFGISGVHPSLTLLSDLKNGTVTNQTNFNFYFNGSSINNSNIYTCNIYENTTVKNTITNQDLTTNKNLSFSLIGDYERWLNFTIDCFNENASNNVSALYYIDNIKSVLNYAFPNGTYYNDEVLYTNFSVSDTNLYSIEWLVYQGATLKENISHKNIATETYEVYNISAVSQITGNYNFILNVWENHNPLLSPELFSEYEPNQNNTSGELTFIKDDTKYSIISKENLAVTTETRDLKQFFTYTEPKTKLIYYTYYVKYDGTLIYLPNSKYKGHFVLDEIHRYIDFQCDDYVKVFKENEHLYRIETPCTKFETTGNLNFMQFTGNFTITTPPSLSNEYLLSLNETMTEQNNILNTIGEGLNMLWFIIALLCVSLVPYFTKNNQRTLIYICITITAVLLFINETINYFNLERQTQILLSSLLMGVIVIHVYNLFEPDFNPEKT